MDQNTKKKIIMIRDLIKNEKYKQALQQAEIVVYKNSKIFQAHLMAGLCLQKLNRLVQAQKSYKQVLDLKPDQPNALKSLCDIYTKMGRLEESTKYMESMLTLQKKTEPVKYRQNLVKLVEMYHKNLDMEKIDVVFKELLESEKEITEEFVAIAGFYFRTATENQCFFLDNFLPLGLLGEGYRPLLPSAKQKLNSLLIDIVRYLYSVRIHYKMSNKDIASSIYQMKQCFPYASCFLLLFLLDEYIVSQAAYNTVILQQVYLMLTAYYDKVENCYTNFQVLEPEYFGVSAILGYQYLAFMKEFFVLDQCFNPYFDRLGAQLPEIQARCKIRQQYKNKIDQFLLKQCRNVSKISQTQNIQPRLQSLKYRITKLDSSYLEQVIAKMAMNCLTSYQKLCDMRNLLKTRIRNLQDGDIQPHLYKYYYDYLWKISKMYKALDEEIGVYEVIGYVRKNDQGDLRYRAEYCWIQVGKQSKQDKGEFLGIVKENLKEIQAILPQLTGSLKSLTIRRQTVLKIALEEYEAVLDGFKLALGTDRSFQNLECIGFYYFVEGDFERALRFLKEAFVIKQDDYHLNRAIFVAMVKLNDLKQANSFLQRIYEGFPNVYWVNYALAMNAINNKRIEQAYKYLSQAFEAFTSSMAKTFNFSYQKTIEGDKFSLLYMIDQNNYHILEDHIVVPEKKIYELFPLASSLFFNSDQELKQIRLETQLGEILKILGRNKSSYNHLASAHAILESLPKQVLAANPLQTIATKKQYATMLFYVRAYKESQQILREALTLCLQQQVNPKTSPSLLSTYQSEIRSLLFEVSVMRLDDLMKFQSYQSVEQYIHKFNQELLKLKSQVKKPSLNYYKAKYQFYILCYLHNKNIGIEQSIDTIREFLDFFGLNSRQISSDKFYNRLVQLGSEQKIIVKQCLEDYFVLLYMRQNSSAAKQEEKIDAESVLPLIQLFPTSSVFYIVYGMAVKETKLKIAAFLKCIQLDRESPISVDLLASLFLKQKDYITACKLFLKSLEIDLFNPKGYIGLCTCLYVLIGCSIKRGSPQDKQLIRRSLSKINSYMQFLRISDPSQNYHVLKFLRTLISDQPIPLFELKAGLEQSRKLAAHKYSQKLLFQLLEDSTRYLKQENVWSQEGQARVLGRYLENCGVDAKEDLHHIAKVLLAKIETQICESKLGEVKSAEIRLKLICKYLNKMSIVGNLFIKAKRVDRVELDLYTKLCGMLEEEERMNDEELLNLQKMAKEVIINAVIRCNNKDSTEIGTVLDKINELNTSKIFKHVQTFVHIQTVLDHFALQKHHKTIKRYIFRCLHLCPCDASLRKILLSWLLVVQKQNNKAPKKIKSIIDYRLESQFQMNTDQQASNSEHFHKKHALMYNIQEPNAWVGFIAAQWAKNRDTKWIPHLVRVVGIGQQQQESRLTGSSREKGLGLLVEMSAERMRKGEKVDLEKYSQDIKDKIQALSTLFKIFQSGKDQEISVLLKNQSESVQLWLLKYILPHLVSKYENSDSIQEIIDICIKKSQKPTEKGFYYLLKFVSVCSRSSKNEDELVDQLKKLFAITSECQTTDSESSSVKVHKNSLAIMKCMIALLSLNYEQLEQQLTNVYEHKIVTYSDQIIINYFEVMKSYKEVQTNHQGQNVYQNFTYFVDCMITMAKEPYLKGFFHSLKALAGAIVADQNSQKLSRDLKIALLLSPVEGKQILTKQ